MASHRIALAPYDPAWQSQGAALINELRSSLGTAALRIDHVGSTAISGMAAKPVFDVQVSVGDLDGAAARFDAPLGALGFRRLPYEHDHVPVGRADDPDVWAKRLWVRRGRAEPDANLHARATGSPNERVALLFRDWLRSHPAAVSAYSSFKLSLAEAVPDLEGYTDLKDPIVDLILVAAEPWAHATGWSP
jgi:GrpB-like predicted nucleotidyltransferase (UPF0157 family)